MNTQLNILFIKSYVEDRLNICKECKLYSFKAGGYCNDKVWYNPTTDKISIIKRDGYTRGCGCILDRKIRNIDSTCPINK